MAARAVLAIVAAMVMVAVAAASDCSLSFGGFSYSGVEQNNVQVQETLSFTPAGSYERTLQTSYINNCGEWSYVAGGTYRTAAVAGADVLTLSQAYCVNRTFNLCLPCPPNGDTDFQYAFSPDCAVLAVTNNDVQRFYYGQAQKSSLSGGAVFGIIFAVLLAAAGAVGAVYYYSRQKRRGYWSISNLPSEPTSKF